MNKNFTLLKNNYYKSQYRYFILQGGTRSGKTYSSLMFLVWLATKEKLQILITRDYYETIKRTILPDFFEIVESANLGYTREDYNKQDKVFQLGESVFYFLGGDDESKFRGVKCDICYINEASSFSKKVFQQLRGRTRGFFVIDYNPSENTGWYYDLIEHKKSLFLKTTYKDNLKYLTRAQIEEIEDSKEYDLEYYNVYALGERGSGRKGKILTNVEVVQEMPKKFLNAEVRYGLDFGKVKDENALIEVHILEDTKELYVRELLYQTNLNDEQLAAKFVEKNVDKNIEMWADSAEPLRIRDLKKYGYNVFAVSKQEVFYSLMLLKKYKIYYSIEESYNFHIEVNGYKWKVNKEGESLNEPQDKLNHLADSLRYAIIRTQINVKPTEVLLTKLNKRRRNLTLSIN